MPKWEYKLISDKGMTEDQLNAVGLEGWELVAIGGVSGSQYTFKRPLKDRNLS